MCTISQKAIGNDILVSRRTHVILWYLLNFLRYVLSFSIVEEIKLDIINLGRIIIAHDVPIIIRQ